MRDTEWCDIDVIGVVFRMIGDEVEGLWSSSSLPPALKRSSNYVRKSGEQTRLDLEVAESQVTHACIL